MKSRRHRFNTPSMKSLVINLALVVGLMLAMSAQASDGLRLTMDDHLGSTESRSGWDAVGLKSGTPKIPRPLPSLPKSRLARGDWKTEGLSDRKVEMARRMFLMTLSYR